MHIITWPYLKLIDVHYLTIVSLDDGLCHEILTCKMFSCPLAHFEQHLLKNPLRTLLQTLLSFLSLRTRFLRYFIPAHDVPARGPSSVALREAREPPLAAPLFQQQHLWLLQLCTKRHCQRQRRRLQCPRCPCFSLSAQLRRRSPGALLRFPLSAAAKSLTSAAAAAAQRSAACCAAVADTGVVVIVTASAPVIRPSARFRLRLFRVNGSKCSASRGSCSAIVVCRGGACRRSRCHAHQRRSVRRPRASCASSFWLQLPAWSQHWVDRKQSRPRHRPCELSVHCCWRCLRPLCRAPSVRLRAKRLVHVRVWLTARGIPVAILAG